MVTTKLPRLSDALRVSEDDIDVLTFLSENVKELSGEVFYASQLHLKLEEAIQVRTECSFIKKPFKWVKEIRTLLGSDISVDVQFRNKGVFSLLSKMNRTMAEGKSINSIHDLMGLEFIVLTPTQKDNAETVAQAYTVANVILEFFSNSTKSGEEFMLCDASELKDVFDLRDMLDQRRRSDILPYLQRLNKNCHVPLDSSLSPNFIAFVKDYYRQPKITSCYQGLQFVLKTKRGIYFEIQVKTQAVYEYKNAPDSLANHIAFRDCQTKNNQENVVANPDAPQFDLTLSDAELEEVHITGFRNGKNDRSGIMCAKEIGIV